MAQSHSPVSALISSGGPTAQKKEIIESGVQRLTQRGDF
jgi:hypothetical protein